MRHTKKSNQRRPSHLVQRNVMIRYSQSFNGYYYACNQYGHRARDYRVAPRRSTKYVNRNSSTLVRNMHVVCYKCDNLGHIAKDCRLDLVKPTVLRKRKNKKKNMPYKVNMCFHDVEKKANISKKKNKMVWREKEW